MRIVPNSLELIHEVRFLNAAKRGGVESQRLPLLRGRVDALPAELDALVLTSDLQGVTSSWRHGGENVLLGIQVVEELFDLADDGKIPALSDTGVILAGDLYAAPGGDKRGATGDVRDVWLAFSTASRWVVGVAGNHDQFGSRSEQERFERAVGFGLLDAAVADRDGLAIGGVSYIIGNPEKSGRRDVDEFFAALDLVLENELDILALHEGPLGARVQRGNPVVRERIEERGYRRGAKNRAGSRETLVVCGHVHWDDPIAELDGAQVINVDSRVVILVR